MTINVGDHIIFTRQITVEEDIGHFNIEPEEFFAERDQYVVTSLNNDGTLNGYEYLTWTDEDDDGNIIELDEPIGDGFTYYYDREDSEFIPYTIDMLFAESNKNNFGSDAICKKVKQLYQKFNSKNTGFKFANV